MPAGARLLPVEAGAPNRADAVGQLQLPALGQPAGGHADAVLAAPTQARPLQLPPAVGHLDADRVAQAHLPHLPQHQRMPRPVRLGAEHGLPPRHHHGAGHQRPAPGVGLHPQPPHDRPAGPKIPQGARLQAVDQRGVHEHLTAVPAPPGHPRRPGHRPPRGAPAGLRPHWPQPAGAVHERAQHRGRVPAGRGARVVQVARAAHGLPLTGRGAAGGGRRLPAPHPHRAAPRLPHPPGRGDAGGAGRRAPQAGQLAPGRHAPPHAPRAPLPPGRAHQPRPAGPAQRDGAALGRAGPAALAAPPRPAALRRPGGRLLPGPGPPHARAAQPGAFRLDARRRRRARAPLALHLALQPRPAGHGGDRRGAADAGGHVAAAPGPARLRRHRQPLPGVRLPGQQQRGAAGGDGVDLAARAYATVTRMSRAGGRPLRQAAATGALKGAAPPPCLPLPVKPPGGGRVGYPLGCLSRQMD
mmetsp:Transcript_40995/g.104855  ORF Transcript_40995/g.104855 Transcript_40995/m.104855 type:complete len:470 (+) Transcript_40995:120-1529(+)